MTKTKVAVVLSGCGVQDGSEIHESVLCLLALDRAGCEVECVAPDRAQLHVVDHLTGQRTSEKRNVRVESARIARGPVRDIAKCDAAEYDAIVLPGGFGAAKNLCDFATRGADCSVDPGVARFLGDALDARRPIAVACIAPAVLAAVLRDRAEGAELTIGNDAETARNLVTMGIVHVPCQVDQAHTDPERPIVSTPAYMLARGIAETADSIDAMIAGLLELVATRKRG